MLLSIYDIRTKKLLCELAAAADAAAFIVVVVGVFSIFRSKYTYLGFSVNSECPLNQLETINTNNNGISVYTELQKYIWCWIHRTQCSLFRCLCHCSFFISDSFSTSFTGSSFSAFHVDFMSSVRRERKKIVHKNIHVHVIHESSQRELQTNQYKLRGSAVYAGSCLQSPIDKYYAGDGRLWVHNATHIWRASFVLQPKK